MASSKDMCCVLFALILSAEVGRVAAAVPIKGEGWSVPIKAEARILVNGESPEERASDPEERAIIESDPGERAIIEKGGKIKDLGAKDLGTDGEVFALAAFALKSLKEQSCTGGDSECKIIGDILKDMSLHSVKAARTIEFEGTNPYTHVAHLHLGTKLVCSTSSIAKPSSEHGIINFVIYQNHGGGVIKEFEIDMARTPESKDGPRGKAWTKGTTEGWIDLLKPFDKNIKGSVLMNPAAFEEFKAGTAAKAGADSGLKSLWFVIILIMVAVACWVPYLYQRRTTTRPNALVGGINV